MKHLKITAFVFVMTAFLGVFNSYARSKSTTKTPPVYMFGFAASFNDSIVYMTDIQAVDSAIIGHKSNFLVNRAAYANQLQFFLMDNQKKSNATCVVFFDRKADKLQKKYQKIMKRYQSNKETLLQVLPKDQFHFVPEINKVLSE